MISNKEFKETINKITGIIDTLEDIILKDEIKDKILKYKKKFDEKSFILASRNNNLTKVLELKEKVSVNCTIDLIVENNEKIHGTTALHEACAKGHDEIIAYLLLAQADVNKKTLTGGFTPLHAAAYNGHAQAVELLIGTSKIQFDVQDDNGYTPQDGAKISGREDIALLIEQKKLNVMNMTGTKRVNFFNPPIDPENLNKIFTDKLQKEREEQKKLPTVRNPE